MSDEETEARGATANDAEISVLGAAMLGADVDALARIVRPEDFYDLRRITVWRAIQRVRAAGQRPDVVNVRAEMESAGEQCDPLELFRWTELVPAVAAAEHYAHIVANAAGHRALETAGIRVAQLGRSSGDLAEHREMARQTVDAACAGREQSRARMLADVIPSVIETAEHGQAGTLSTPWGDLDDLIGGIAPGRLVVVGARPGVGKSVMGTNLALHVAHHHAHAVLVASMEMPEDEVGQRLMAAHAAVNLTGLQKGTLSEAEWNRVAARTAEMQAMPLRIDDTAEQSVQHIRATARDYQRVRDDLALIVVDYLQLMDTGRKSDNRANDLAQVSRGLKLLARETGACVVAMAQVNREAAKRGRPTSADLRESGAIEADADQVLLLHQPDPEIPELEVIVDKNRHGPKGVRPLMMLGHYARLVLPTWSPSSQAAS